MAENFLTPDQACAELDERFGERVLSPMPYAFPLELMVESVPEKEVDFGNPIPAAGHYQYGPGEMRAYYTRYQKARFGLTTKKGGWEALRHLEISGNGCVPLMPDVARSPAYTLCHSPRDLYLEAWRRYGEKVKVVDGGLRAIHPSVVEDEAAYLNLAQRILTHARMHQSTEAVARWFLERCGVGENPRVLFVANARKICYSTETLFHGLRTVLGSSLVDVPKLDYMYDSFPQSRHGELYGNGYGYASLLPDIALDRTRVRQRMASGAFDLLVFGQLDRASALLPWARRCVSPERIALVDGGDEPALLGFPGSARVRRPWWQRWGLRSRELSFLGHLFKREIDTVTLEQYASVRARRTISV